MTEREKDMGKSDEDKLSRIMKAWNDLLPLGDDNEVIGRASEMLGLEGYELYRLRDAIRGRKSNYTCYDDQDKGGR